MWRVRIIAPPRAKDFDEYDVRRFEVGEVYEVSSRLASLLVLGGYAEHLTSGVARAEAAERSPHRDDSE